MLHFGSVDIPATFDELVTLMRARGVSRFSFTEVSTGGVIVQREIQLVGAVGPGAAPPTSEARTDPAGEVPHGPSPAELVLHPPKFDPMVEE